ncbi:unnamed protein product [Urochloa humidicola]
MASIITRLSHHLALSLFLAQLTNSALVPQINNQPALKPQASNTYIVHANHLAKPPHFASLEHWYHSVVGWWPPTHLVPWPTTPAASFQYTYDTVMHGFAVQLTGDKARHMASAAGVNGVFKDRLLHHRTTRSPGFLGLDPAPGATQTPATASSIIIGFVDSGIWPESPSFNDKGLGPVRSSWRGKCVDAHDFNASLLSNNKLVGAKVFDAGEDAMRRRKSDAGARAPSPRDGYGQGTHVASTAVGSEVRDTGVHMFARGTAQYVSTKRRSEKLVDTISWSRDGTDTLRAYMARLVRHSVGHVHGLPARRRRRDAH